MLAAGILLHLIAAHGREIIFPPIAVGGSQIPQLLNSANEDFTKFAGLQTFANLPWVHCLSTDGVEKYDVAFLGLIIDRYEINS